MFPSTAVLSANCFSVRPYSRRVDIGSAIPVRLKFSRKRNLGAPEMTVERNWFLRMNKIFFRIALYAEKS
jgi:hypothetical protein